MIVKQLFLLQSFTALVLAATATTTMTTTTTTPLPSGSRQRGSQIVDESGIIPGTSSQISTLDAQSRNPAAPNSVIEVSSQAETPMILKRQPAGASPKREPAGTSSKREPASTSSKQQRANASPGEKVASIFIAQREKKAKAANEKAKAAYKSHDYHSKVAKVHTAKLDYFRPFPVPSTQRVLGGHHVEMQRLKRKINDLHTERREDLQGAAKFRYLGIKPEGGDPPVKTRPRTRNRPAPVLKKAMDEYKAQVPARQLPRLPTNSQSTAHQRTDEENNAIIPKPA